MVGNNGPSDEALDRRTLSRRKALGAISTGMAAIAGCAGGNGGSETTTTTPTTTTTTKEPTPTFEIRKVNAPEIVQMDEELTIQPIIANAGDAGGEPTVSVSIGPLQEQKTLQAIQPGTTDTPSFSMSVSALDPGRYNLALGIKDQSWSKPVDVWEPIDQPGVYGSVYSEAGGNVGNAYLPTMASIEDNREHPRVQPNSYGKFSFSHPFQSEYRLGMGFLKEVIGRDNGLPPTWGLFEPRRVTPGEITILGRFELPETYRTQIQFVDANGDPIPQFSGIDISDPMGYGLGPRRLTTNNEGYVIGKSSSEPGLHLPSKEAGKFAIEGDKPEQRPEHFGYVYGSPDGESFKFTVENPDAFGTK